jgi:hypothetical protein
MAVGIAVFAESLTIVQTAADERIGREWPRRMGRDEWAETDGPRVAESLHRAQPVTTPPPFLPFKG